MKYIEDNWKCLIVLYVRARFLTRRGGGGLKISTAPNLRRDLA